MPTDQDYEEPDQLTASSSESSLMGSTTMEPDEPEKKRMKTTSRGTKEIVTTKLSMILDRCKVTDRNAVMILSATIEALELNPIDYIISRSALRSRRQEFREKYTEEMHKRLSIPDEEPLVVHWDGKLLPQLLNNENCERLAILVSYDGKEQLLGVPNIENSTGESQGIAVFESLEYWCLSNKVKAMCFDTTASNTGRMKGACVILEKMVERDLLYLACRHHIYEVILKAVFDCKMGSTTAPHPDIFKKFQSAWSEVDLQKFQSGVEDERIQEFLTPEIIEEMSVFLKKCYTEDQPRADYKELLKLALVFIGKQNEVDITFKKPGAFHHARWMAKAIYCLKIYLFRGQLKMTQDQIQYIGDICVFLLRVYLKAWFNAPKAYLAPSQDLSLLGTLLEYNQIDKSISEAALKKLCNHLWYLNPENVAMGFFDPTLSLTEKSAMALKVLRSIDDMENSKTVNPSILLKDIPSYVQGGLVEFVNSHTMDFFKRFGIDSAFLEKNPEQWVDDIQYQKGVNIVQKLKVVNDTAERGVKVMQDFNNLLTYNEEQKQYVLQVVSECRKLYPESSKKSLCP